MSFPLGQPVTLTFHTYSDAAETIPADPTSLTLVILRSDGDVEPTLHWPTPADVTRVSVGLFTYDYLPPLPGAYAAAFDADGAVTTAQPVRFTVDAPYGAYTSVGEIRLIVAGTENATGTAAGLSDSDISEAIGEAQQEVDGRLSARYTTPFVNPPKLVASVTRDIAAYLATLTSRRGEPISPGESILLRYSRAQTLLTQMATGVFPLQIPDATPGDEEAASDGAVTNPVDGELWDAADFRLTRQPAGFPAWPRPW